MACCKACSGRSKAKVAGMKKSTSKLITNGLYVAGGILIGGAINRTSFAQANPMLKIALPAAGAFLATKFMGAKGAPLAAGMVALAATNAVGQFAPSVAAQVGISGGVPFKSTYLPGVAGVGQQRQANGVKVVMQ